MDVLSSHEITVMFLALGVLLSCARFLGEVARRLHQPAILGEILAGILLGPTVLGTFFPEAGSLLFPSLGGSALVLDGITTLAIALFLLVAGMEVDISTIWRQGRAVTTVGLAGIVVPFGCGFLVAYLAPRVMGLEPGGDPLMFAFFFATALSISALPVIAKTLMDLDLYRSDLGMMIVAAAVFNDLIGWIIFAIILGMIGTTAGHALSIGVTISLTLGFAIFMLTAGRWLIHRVLPWILAHSSWPGGILGFTLALALFGAAFTEWIGVHAIFGSFLVGVAIGDTPHFRERIRNVIEQFVSFIFAPLFFASIGLKVNFLTHFDPALILVVLAIACFGKVVGCGLGGRLAGMPPREAWAIGFGMNARGAMEIILGLLALQFGLIGERLFVALVIMALVTSLMSGPAIQHILRLKKPRRFIDFLPPRGLVHLSSVKRDEAVAELVDTLHPIDSWSPEAVVRKVLDREKLMSTGLGNGIAVPHARLDDMEKPLVGIGISGMGIDFEAPDGMPAHLVFLILTPREDDGAQLEILADIARTFRDEEMRSQAVSQSSYTELLALVKSGETR